MQATSYEILFAVRHVDDEGATVGAWASYCDKWCSVSDVDDAADGDETMYYARDAAQRVEMQRLLDSLYGSIDTPAPAAWPYHTDEQLAMPLPKGATVYRCADHGKSLTFAVVRGHVACVQRTDGIDVCTIDDCDHDTAKRLLGEYVDYAAALQA